MWEYIFDYQQRIITQDKLSMNELCLLFYFSKQIISQEFLEARNPSEYKDFLYIDIVKALPILNIEVKQLKNLINKLLATGYIQKQKLFAGAKISLTFKALNSLSKRQFEEAGNKKYFFLLKWKNISTLQNETGKKFPTFYSYYLYITKNNYIYNNIININTEEDIIDNSNNINKEKLLLPLFEKYSQFKTKMLNDIKLPKDFDCLKLIQAVDESYFLRNKIGIKFLIKHYDYALRGDYKGEAKEDKQKKLLVKDSKDVGIQQAIFDEDFINYELREKMKLAEKEQKELLKKVKEEAIEKLRADNKFYVFDNLDFEEQEELIEIYVAEYFAKCSHTK